MKININGWDKIFTIVWRTLNHTHTHAHTQDLKEVLVESLEQEEAGRNEIEEARIMEMIESLDEKVSILTFVGHTQSPHLIRAILVGCVCVCVCVWHPFQLIYVSEWVCVCVCVTSLPTYLCEWVSECVCVCVWHPFQQGRICCILFINASLINNVHVQLVQLYTVLCR